MFKQLYYLFLLFVNSRIREISKNSQTTVPLTEWGDNEILTYTKTSTSFKAEVTDSTDKGLEIYDGLTETTFKEKHRNHKTFNKRDHMKNIELPKYIIWSLKDQTKTPHIKWSIVKRVNSRAKLNYCKLCLFEKLFLQKSLGDPRMLNRNQTL